MLVIIAQAKASSWQVSHDIRRNRTPVHHSKDERAMMSENSHSLSRPLRYVMGFAVLAGTCSLAACRRGAREVVRPLHRRRPTAAHRRDADQHLVLDRHRPCACLLSDHPRSRASSKTGRGRSCRHGQRLADPLWARLDDFMRVAIAAFFVAIFAVGGVSTSRRT